MNINERINKTKAAYAITNKMLADEAGLSIQTVINQCGGKHAPCIELISALLTLAPSVDARWLITGKDGSDDDRITRIEDAIKAIESKLGM